MISNIHFARTCCVAAAVCRSSLHIAPECTARGITGSTRMLLVNDWQHGTQVLPVQHSTQHSWVHYDSQSIRPCHVAWHQNKRCASSRSDLPLDTSLPGSRRTMQLDKLHIRLLCMYCCTASHAAVATAWRAWRLQCTQGSPHGVTESLNFQGTTISSAVKQDCTSSITPFRTQCTAEAGNCTNASCILTCWPH
jgi:hypothetical protein